MAINVLSLFDGMSCGRIALERAGIKVDNYFASEIDKYAIRVTQANYPDTIQLGDITEIKFVNTKIDLLLAGSPCQGFSKAGKGLNFDDPRSKLFFEFVRLLNHCRKKNPDLLFLLENVDMLQEWQDIISKAVGIRPIKINSALVSAQNRVRLYWTNIGTTTDMFGHLVPAIPQPKDRGIFLKDILEDEVDEKYYLSDAAVKRLRVCHANFRPQINPEKNGKVYSLESNPSANRIELIGGVINNFEFKANKANNIDANYHKGRDNHGARTMIMNTGSMGNRVYDDNGKSTTLTSSGGGLGGKTGLYQIENIIRRLTPIECERLQGVPDNYTNHVSDSQRYKMLGNGWQIDTIAHILSFLKSTKSKEGPHQTQPIQ